ncbi:MAG: hypothetical protein ACRCUE_04640 [Bosea sp. (in: a-proteobacteria)]
MTTETADIAELGTADNYRLLAREVDLVALYITDLRAAINELGVQDITDRKLNVAHADIHDVIQHTRSATDTVLDTAEGLMAAAETGPAYRELVEDRMIRLMEACSFQDLTGQRLARVAETLNAMEERLQRFAALVKPRGKTHCAGPHEKQREDWRHHNLVSGPGNADAMNQDMIDRLLAKIA